MARALVTLDVAPTDDLRVSPRLGGGFHVHIGPAGASHDISFATSASAEAFAALLTLSALTHGDLGQALAATDNVVAITKGRKS